MRLHSLAALAALLAAAPTAAQQVSPQLQRAAWLAGCWQGGSAARTFEERWSPPRGGTMVGAGRTLRGDSTAAIELTILRVRGDTLRYEAHPVGQAPAVFTTTATTPGELRFENPAHDFPQRIIYRAAGADSVYARIEGPMNGTWRGIDYAMARVRCEP